MQDEKVCGVCLDTGFIFTGDEFESCPKGCLPRDVSEEKLNDDMTDLGDPLLEDNDLFPDQLPEENVRKWDHNDL